MSNMAIYLTSHQQLVILIFAVKGNKVQIKEEKKKKIPLSDMNNAGFQQFCIFTEEESAFNICDRVDV